MVNRFYNATELPWDIVKANSLTNTSIQKVPSFGIFDFKFGQTYYCGNNSNFTAFRVDRIILGNGRNPMYSIHDNKGNKYVLFGNQLGLVFENKKDYLNYIISGETTDILYEIGSWQKRFNLPLKLSNSFEPILYIWTDKFEAQCLPALFDGLWLDNQGAHYILRKMQRFLASNYELSELYTDRIECVKDNFCANDDFEEDKKEPQPQTYVISINVSVEAMSVEEAQKKVEDAVNNQ